MKVSWRTIMSITVYCHLFTFCRAFVVDKPMKSTLQWSDYKLPSAYCLHYDVVWLLYLDHYDVAIIAEITSQWQWRAVLFNAMCPPYFDLFFLTMPYYYVICANFHYQNVHFSIELLAVNMNASCITCKFNLEHGARKAFHGICRKCSQAAFILTVNADWNQFDV